jgi:hypothetical protein
VAGVAVLKLIGKPEVVVAFRLMVDCNAPTTGPAIGEKVMVCAFCPTLKDCVTGGAGKKVPLPACVAVSVQVPEASKFTFHPESVQIDGVEEVTVTFKPEFALGAIDVIPCARYWLASGGKVIACAR